MSNKNFLTVINNGLFKVEKNILTVTVLTMVILALMQVFTRYVSHKPIPWSESLLTYMFIWSSFMGASYALGKKGHFEVDVIVKLFPYKLRLAVNLFVYCIMIAFCGYLVVIGGKMTLMNQEQIMPVLPFSMMWPWLALPVSGATMIVHLLANLAEDLRTFSYHDRGEGQKS